MSRRRGEFEHRTSIFEGAFRAWSHLGGLDAEELESKSAAELDPLTSPLVHDSRLSKSSNDVLTNPDGSKRREYPYEPLPRSGLAHPYVQAILSPWLGPDADNEAIQLGLTTLRTWWQHRRKGESGSAIAALGTEKMNGVVEGYTRHFFTLAHSLVVNDKVQPPRGLHCRIKELEKQRLKKCKKRVREDGKNGVIFPSSGAPNATNIIRADLTNPNLSPLEQLHLAQQHQMEYSQGLISNLPSVPSGMMNVEGSHTGPVLDVPGKRDLPSIVSTINHQPIVTNQNGGATVPPQVITESLAAKVPDAQYGDPNTTPVVLVSGNGDIQIAMTVEGITCSHCIKIVETVLRGCNGNRSPINGLLDAVADRALKSVLIKIDRASNAKRIAFEANRNLSMVGYTARTKEMNIVGKGADDKVTMHLGSLSTVFDVVANTDPQDVFDWSSPCTCPDTGILRSDCKRHSQMNTRIFEAFNRREQQVADFMAGCGRKYGLQCTCGPQCRCTSCPMHPKGGSRYNGHQGDVGRGSGVDQSLDFSQFEMGPPAPIERNNFEPLSIIPNQIRRPTPSVGIYAESQTNHVLQNPDRTSRNVSGLPYGNNGPRNSLRHSHRSSIRGMSITSETTFGRAMSGLSMLSIDWENLDDFDLDVDGSAHVNNEQAGVRRTSIRRSVMSNGSNDNQVSFKV